MTTRQQIVDEAREWLDTRFVHQAMVKGVGCDCAGLIVGVGVATGGVTLSMDDPALKEFAGYSKRPDPALMTKALNLMMVKIRTERAGAGDVIYRRYGPDPQHLGILTGTFKDPMSGVVHALRWPSRKVIEHRTDEDWYHNVTSAWRYPGMVV